MTDYVKFKQSPTQVGQEKILSVLFLEIVTALSKCGKHGIILDGGNYFLVQDTQGFWYPATIYEYKVKENKDETFGAHFYMYAFRHDEWVTKDRIHNSNKFEDWLHLMPRTETIEKFVALYLKMNC